MNLQDTFDKILTMDHLTNDLKKLDIKKPINNNSDQIISQEYILNIIKEYFVLVEQESCSQIYIDKLIEKWRLVPRETIDLLQKLARVELRGIPSDLGLREILKEICYYHVTNFRSTDEYYIEMLIDFMEHIHEY